MSASLDDDIARLALASGWVTEAQLEECRAQAGDGTAGLGNRLVGAKIISAAQLDTLLDRLRAEHHGDTGGDVFGTNFIAGQLARRSADKKAEKESS